jgi:hypothetical protein
MQGIDLGLQPPLHSILCATKQGQLFSQGAGG